MSNNSISYFGVAKVKVSCIKMFCVGTRWTNDRGASTITFSALGVSKTLFSKE